MPDFAGLLNRLVERKVDFTVIGGFAAVAHGCPLLTMDVDVCCEFSPENLLRLQSALADLHPVHRMTPQRTPLVLTAATCRGLRNLYLDTDWGQMDCLSEVKGIGSFTDVRKRSVRVEIEAGPCWILSLEALIRAKEAMGRPRDLEAIAYLKTVARGEQEQG